MEVERRSDGGASVAAPVLLTTNPCLFEHKKESDDDSVDFECPAAKRARVEEDITCPNPAPAPPALQPPPPSLTPPATTAPDNDDDDDGGQRTNAAARLVADKYLILDPVEGSSLFRCVNILTNQEFVCKMASGREAGALVAAHARLWDASALVSPLREALPCAGGACLVLARAAGPDLHTHVRARRRLRDCEARRLFRQAAAAVAACHRRGVVLRDLKLRKFVFADEQRTQLRLESLEDAVVLASEADDRLRDKRGCPAYVSPEILRCPPLGYSGRAADMWSLGVILYTMLVGRYPFNEAQHHALFAKISRGAFALPEQLSAGARCLIRSLLRRDPAQRLTAADVLLHPWLKEPITPTPSSSSTSSNQSPSGGEREAPSSVIASISAPILVPQTPSVRDAGDQVVPDFCP